MEPINSYTLLYLFFTFHRLLCSGSTVVTMTSKVNGKTEILTPCRSETLKNIETKFGNLETEIPSSFTL